MIVIFLILEKKLMIKSIGKRTIHYTPFKIIIRGLLAGLIISITVLLSNVGEVISGIFSVFPAICTSSMFISYYDHGPEFASGLAKSMIIGSMSVVSYAIIVHFVYPTYDILWGSIIAFIIAFIISLIILKTRNNFS
jgi:hypothetical protein